MSLLLESGTLHRLRSRSQLWSLKQPRVEREQGQEGQEGNETFISLSSPQSL